MLDVQPAGRATIATPIATALPADVERRLAELVGIEPIPLPEPVPEPIGLAVEVPAGRETAFTTVVIHIAELMAVGGLLLITAYAFLAARVGSDGTLVHPVWLAGWGFGAAVSAVVLASLARDPGVAGVQTSGRRLLLGTALLSALLVCLSGVVTEMGGLDSSGWVLFLPVVVVVGALLGPVRGLAVGGAAAAGIYAAAALSHSLGNHAVGELIVVLPTCPTLGWWAGSLASTSAKAAVVARSRREKMQRDISVLSGLLGQVADGNLTAVPFLENAADQATTGLAVVLADTVLSLRHLVIGLGGVADQLADSSSELVATIAHHVDAVEEQASSVSWTTSTIEQLASTAGLIAETALRVEAYAGTTRADVDAGTAAAAAATGAMDVIETRVRELEDRSSRLAVQVKQIAVTAGLIDDLSRRTTMLGVSAAIEAARAGPEGAGFTTVAAEIGSLAGRAREATAAISVVVEAIEKEIAAATIVNSEGLAAIAAGRERQTAVVGALERISLHVDDTIDAARTITAATEEQRAASHGVVEAMLRVTIASEKARAATRGHADAASRLSGLATSVRETVARFRVR
ncbi:MAG TPA: methyl-accepting chemotaxis protein [Mycobacteriales bacterium]|nr:methyl-accepting chemotaxis protein [Mycobacteriales bacterium]